MSPKGYDNLIRDPKTNSIINTNMSEYNEYISRRDSKLKENEKVNNLESDITNMLKLYQFSVFVDEAFSSSNLNYKRNVIDKLLHNISTINYLLNFKND